MDGMKIIIILSKTQRRSKLNLKEHTLVESRAWSVNREALGVAAHSSASIDQLAQNQWEKRLGKGEDRKHETKQRELIGRYLEV